MPELLTEERWRARGTGARRHRGRTGRAETRAAMRGWRPLVFGLLAIAAVAPWPSSTAAADTANAKPAAAVKPMKAAELNAFARAARAVFRIRQTYAPKVQAAHSEMDARDFIVSAEKEMGVAIRHEGLTVARYNEILKAAQRDAGLAARIQSLVDKAAAGK